jgi:MinD superfamily P-loop ATPase
MVEPGVVDGLACEGCAACLHRCPTGAISLRPVVTGEWFESATRFGRLFHARLHPGRENSGKLVTAVRTAAKEYAEHEGIDLTLVDGPPGIGCPVIAAATGCDLALLVAEPTVSGAEDLDRALGTVEHFGIPALAVVNRADLHPAWADRIEDRCRERGIEVATRIPFDPEVTRAMVRRMAVTEAGPGPAARALEALADRLERAVA